MKPNAFLTLTALLLAPLAALHAADFREANRVLRDGAIRHGN